MKRLVKLAFGKKDKKKAVNDDDDFLGKLREKHRPCPPLPPFVRQRAARERKQEREGLTPKGRQSATQDRRLARARDIGPVAL